MSEPIVLRGGEVMLPAEVAEADALMPALNDRIVDAMREVRR